VRSGKDPVRDHPSRHAAIRDRDEPVRLWPRISPEQAAARDDAQDYRLEPWFRKQVEVDTGDDDTVGAGLGTCCWRGLNHRERESTEDENDP
jgi:hypothetical protein